MIVSALDIFDKNFSENLSFKIVLNDETKKSVYQHL